MEATNVKIWEGEEQSADDTVTVDSNDSNVRYINVNVYPNFSDELLLACMLCLVFLKNQPF